MKFTLSLFDPKMPVFAVYMLQQVEYRAAPFIAWMKHMASQNMPLSRVMHRRTLDVTPKARLLLGLLYACAFLWLVQIVWLVWRVPTHPEAAGFLLLSIIFLPTLLLVLAIICVELAHVVIVGPAERRLMAQTKAILKKHTGTIVVVAGSYGKTTMKELLAAVLGTTLNVAATAGNRNTPSAHSQFVRGLTGDEDVIIFELGEGAPGDVERFAATLAPDTAIITGLAPNHLDQYGTIDEIARDFMALKRYVSVDKLYCAADSEMLRKYISHDDQTYAMNGGKTWNISGIRVSAEGTSFSLKYAGKRLNIQSALLGRHQVAPLALVAVIALAMGLEVDEVERAIIAVKPYEHRMSPYQLNGATIIDDTYNGNFEGIMAGLSFMSEIVAKRKIYVTPGLVDQGDETDRVHRRIAAKITEVNPDVLVLMRNSATDIIADELTKHCYAGDIQVQDDPLLFYQGLEHIIRAGDIVLMQNDWTDNYV